METLPSDCGFKIYLSEALGSVYALAIVAHSSGVDDLDFLEYHICLSSLPESACRGKLTKEENLEAEPAARETTRSMADFGKSAAEAALSRCLLECGSKTRSSVFDPANLWFQEGTTADVLTLRLQGTFAQFLEDTMGNTSCPRLQGFLRRISGMSPNSRALGM